LSIFSDDLYFVGYIRSFISDRGCAFIVMMIAFKHVLANGGFIDLLITIDACKQINQREDYIFCVLKVDP